MSSNDSATAKFSDGTIYNVKLQQNTNVLNNVGLRGQLLYAPSENLAVALSFDDTRQRANGYTQVPAGVAPTQRPANRQWAAITADLNYAPPSLNAFDRQTDIDSPLRSNQDLGGAALNIDWKLGPGRLTSTTPTSQGRSRQPTSSPKRSTPTVHSRPASSPSASI